MPFYTCDPEIEINGVTVLSLTQNIQHGEIASILQEHGFASVNPESWYSLQAILNVLHKIGDGGNAMTNFVSIGISAGELGVSNLPPELGQIAITDFLIQYRHVYKTRHRNGEPGDVIGEQVTENHVKITFIDTPYPDDIMYGVMYAYARHFLTGSHFTLRYDSDLHRDRNGGDTTVMHLEWN
jgi:hypothetical protein